MIEETTSDAHWDGCWLEPDHHDCAVLKISRLECDLAKQRKELQAKAKEARTAQEFSAIKARQVAECHKQMRSVQAKRRALALDSNQWCAHLASGETIVIDCDRIKYPIITDMVRDPYWRFYRDDKVVAVFAADKVEGVYRS